MADGKKDLALREGRDRFHKGDYSGARASFQDCLDLDPDNVAALTGLGLSQSRLGRHDRAVETFDEVSKLRPKSPAVQFAKGLALHRAGKKAESATAFELVLDAQPEHESAIAWLNRLKPAAPAPRKAAFDEVFDEELKAEEAVEAAEEAVEAADPLDGGGEEVIVDEAVEAGAETMLAPAADLDDMEVEADDASTEFDVDEVVAEAEAEVEAGDEAETKPPSSKRKPTARPKGRGKAEEEEPEPEAAPGPLRWPHFGVNPLEKDDGWGGMKVVKCERGLLKVKGARNVTFQKESPNVVEPGFLGFGGKKLSAKDWTLIRFTFKEADKKNPEKGVIECVDGEGKTRFSIPGGKTVDGKALYGLRAAVHLARMFQLDLEIEGDPMNGDEELKAAVEALKE